MHLYSSHVAYGFQNDAASHSDHKTPCFGSEAQEDLGEEKDGEYADVKRVSCEGWEILIMGLKERAGCQSAIFVWDCGIGN